MIAGRKIRSSRARPSRAAFACCTASHRSHNLKSQFVISSWGGSRHRPYAFTENGVARLSSVLRSEKAIAVNIEIMRTFSRLRRLLATHEDLARKFSELESSVDARFADVFDAIRELAQPAPETPKERIGFVTRRTDGSKGRRPVSKNWSRD